MKIEIEISEEQAACLWANHWGEESGWPIEKMALVAVQDVAAEYRRAFPESVESAVARFRKFNAASGPKEVAR